MIDLSWFEQFSNFDTFHIMIKYYDSDIDDFDDLRCCCSYLSYDFNDSFVFIRDFVNVNYSVVDFDFNIYNSSLNISIFVEAV